MRKNNRPAKIFLVIAVIFLLNSVIEIRPLYSKEEEEVDIQKHIRLFTDAFVLIKENYVEDITIKDLIYGAMKGMISSLDSYSQFMEPEVAKLVKSDTEGEFGGLGIRITSRDGYITVITPLPDTPAFSVGIMPGDKIVKIDGEDAKGIELRDAVKKLRGEAGTKVTLSMAREEEEELLEFTITRDTIVPTKVYKKLLEKNIGYIRLVEFTDDAPLKLKEALDELMGSGIDGLVFDLRNNPGGLLSAAVEIAGFFVDKGEMIVYTKGRREDQNREFRAMKEPEAKHIPLAVLINKGSASGSEIVAGCIKDLSRGVVIGEVSFGKASVQSLIDLEDASSLRLTTAKYYTPSGVSIHDKGIEPDITVKISKEERIKLASQQEEILNLSVEEKEKREKDKIVDPQLQRACDVLIARKIFMKDGRKEEEIKKSE
ncbi:MAG: S41 family peptidase [Elusimicrobiota bacterium]